jgi:hypothetical protein
MKKRAFLTDFLAILIFVLIGRDAHKHSFSITGIASTLWPFAVGLLLAWVYLHLRHLDGTSRRSGAIIVLTTVTIGMLLRVVSGQGTTLTFIIVALIFLSLMLIGWRELASRLPFRK